jgi:ArsR family transcriptional regulator
MAGDIYDFRTQITRALANPIRLKIIDQLDPDQEKCVCELVESLGCDQPSVSKHLAVLRNAGLVAFRQDGTKMLYRLKTRCVKDFLACIDRVIRQDIQTKVEELDQVASCLKMELGR